MNKKEYRSGVYLGIAIGVAIATGITIIARFF